MQRSINFSHHSLRTTIGIGGRMVRTSSLRTITILRETLKSFERRPSYDPIDPVFIHLECRILCWITELYVLAARRQEAIKQNEGGARWATVQWNSYAGATMTGQFIPIAPDASPP
jgi:hypothetical protein